MILSTRGTLVSVSGATAVEPKGDVQATIHSASSQNPRSLAGRARMVGDRLWRAPQEVLWALGTYC
jgi:hypothetical protein